MFGLTFTVSADESPMSTRPKNHFSRQQKYAAVAATLTIIIAGIVTAVFFGSSNEPEPAKNAGPTTEQVRFFGENLVENYGPAEDNTFGYMVTPATPDWWQTITSAAPNSYMWLSPAPARSVWYAVMFEHADQGQTETRDMYQAIHVGFVDEVEAKLFASSITGTEQGGYVSPVVRGNVVTLLPTWVIPEYERYEDPEPGFAETTSSFKPKTGVWEQDLGGYIEDMATQGSPYEKNFQDFWKRTGLTTETNLSLTALKPREWSGTWEGFSTENLSVGTIFETISETIPLDCDPDGSNCIQTGFGISVLAEYVAFKEAQKKDGPRADRFGKISNLPRVAKQPPQGLFGFALNLGAIEGQMNQSTAAPNPPYEWTAGWLTRDGEAEITFGPR